METVYRALADETRRQILRLLAAGERTQAEIVAQFPLSQPAIAKHMRVLKEAGLVRERRSGRSVYYRLDEARVADAYAAIRREWEALLDRRLAKLKHYLEREEDGR